MKALYYQFSLSFLLLIVVVGCKDDFLDLAPVSNANVENFYKTAEDINNAVIAAYKFHKNIYATDFSSQSVLDEIRSDNTTMVQIDVVDRFIRDSGKEWWGWSWDKSYRAIYLCNIAMEKATGVTMDDGLRNRYIAEVRFLRAITYFELVRNFGDVPLVTETPASLEAEAVQIPRTPTSEVYSQIVNDLLFAEENLPLQYSEEENIGRATKGAAQGILGKVYLTLGQKEEAETVLREVVNSGVYQLLEDYAAVWDVNNDNSEEILFELQFKSTTDGSPFPNNFASINAENIPGGGRGYNLATEDLVNAYESGDIRKELTMTSDLNGIYYTIKFSDPNMSVGFDSEKNFPILRYADVLLLLAEAIGESPEAYDLINQVRQRAKLDPIGSASPGTFEEKLLQERRVELAFENHRWHDLLRFGVAIEVMNDHLAPLGITLNENDLLMPIPQTALVTNPRLEQNPGYN